MGYAILRTQKLKSMQSVKRSLKHSFREQDTPNADPALTPENTHLGAENVKDAIEKISTRLPEKIRKNGVLAIEYLVTASPEDMHAKSRKEQDAYFSDAKKWLEEKPGAANVIYAGIHRDETTPHMYAYVVPIDSKGKLNCRAFLGGAKALSEMQTDFADRVGKKHKLERGIEGSRAKHTKVREFYGAIDHAPHKHAHFTPEQLKPKMLEKGIFINEYESPEGTAERLSNLVKKHYEPAIKEASVSRLERDKRKQTEETSKRKDMELKKAQERLQGFDNAFKGLSQPQMQELAELAAAKRRSNEIEQEQQKRIDALPALNSRGTGAAKTFARHALEALKKVDMDYKKVNWTEVENSTKKESKFEHHQPVYEIAKALLTYSPGQADKNEASRKAILEQAKEMDRKEMPSREAGKTKTFGPER
jgi:hypothetical protein